MYISELGSFIPRSQREGAMGDTFNLFASPA
jgi:hypothetical protein